MAAGGPEVADELEASGYAAFSEDDATTADGRPAVRPSSLDELFSTR